jgi:hypothetical protein
MEPKEFIISERDVKLINLPSDKFEYELEEYKLDRPKPIFKEEFMQLF